MSLKSDIHCPTSNGGHKITVENALERRQRREQRKLIREIQENLRASFEIDGIKVTDAQFEQMIAAAKYLEDNAISMTDEQYIKSDENLMETMTTDVSEENLDKLAQISMQSIMDADLNNTTFSGIETKYKCLATNQTFSNFIYLNAGWLTTEKCPCCKEHIKTDGSNYKQFWDNHREII